MGLAGSVGNCFHMSLPRRVQKDNFSIKTLSMVSDMHLKFSQEGIQGLPPDGTWWGEPPYLCVTTSFCTTLLKGFCCHPNLTFFILTGYVYETWTSINTTTTKDSKIIMNVMTWFIIVRNSKTIIFGGHLTLRYQMTQHFSQQLRNISRISTKRFGGITPSGSAPMKLSKLPNQKLLGKNKRTFVNFIVCRVPSKKYIFYESIIYESLIAFLDVVFQFGRFKQDILGKFLSNFHIFDPMRDNKIHQPTGTTIDWCVYWNILMARVSPQCYPPQEIKP